MVFCGCANRSPISVISTLITHTRFSACGCTPVSNGANDNENVTLSQRDQMHGVINVAVAAEISQCLGAAITHLPGVYVNVTWNQHCLANGNNRVTI